MTKLHSLNKSFGWEDRPVTHLQACSQQQVQQFNLDGFFVMKSAIAKSGLTKLLTQVDPIERRGGGSTLVGSAGEIASYGADELTFTCNLVNRSSVLADFYEGSLFRGITHDLIGTHSRLYWEQAVYKHPKKGGEFPWHQDNGYTFVTPQAYVTCWIALSDAPVKSGCPWVIPGAHRAGTYRHKEQPYGLEIVDVAQLLHRHGERAVPVNAGDIVVFSSLTPHKTGPNFTSHIRKALIVQFIPDGAVRVEPTGIFALDDPVLNMKIGPK